MSKSWTVLQFFVLVLPGKLTVRLLNAVKLREVYNLPWKLCIRNREFAKYEHCYFT